MKTVTTKDELIAAVEAGTFPFQLMIDGIDYKVVRRGHTDHRNAVDLFYTANNQTYAFTVEDSKPVVHEVYRLDSEDFAEREDEEYIDNCQSADGRSTLALIIGGRFARPLFQ